MDEDKLAQAEQIMRNALSQFEKGKLIRNFKILRTTKEEGVVYEYTPSYPPSIIATFKL